MGIQDEMFEAVKCRYDDLVELNKATVAENERLRADKAEACRWLSWIDLKDTRNARKYINEAMHYLKGEDDG